MPVEKVYHKAKGEIIKYTCDFCNAEYDNQKDLFEHANFVHKMKQ
ncbi:hypothetical protein Ngar_c10000 [Candidatus Nitrososphaera gargensis Ga9.2]|uniref:C2H2-type domain-containing protein n=1 Tax=Nitrososphaera gargensis (strain Ga9.2) TaxID=1237085 RepID=K0IIM4_NITGG|nr:hypothetical protein Ngar_c10000 [Candidatus Nitrososphaera gargensis Ga9.2]